MADREAREQRRGGCRTMVPAVREIALKLKKEQVRDKYKAIRFDEYLEMIREDPRLIRSSYQRLYDMIISHGTHSYKRDGKEITHYRFFDDPFGDGEDAIYGIDEALKNVVDIFEGAAK